MNAISARRWSRVLLVCVFVCLAVSASAAGEEDFVRNPGFEAVEDGFPAHWNGDRQIYGSSTEARSGQRSLHFENEDPDVYRLCLQDLDLTPGRRYKVSAWIKTKNIRGDGGGATLCLEWQKDGEHMGGSYPSGLTGTNDWTHWEHIMQTIPKQADSVHIVCYVRRGMTGEAWFDDIEINQVKRPALQTTLTKPGYRGWMYENWPQDIVVRAQINTVDYDFSLDELRLKAEVAREDGETPVSETQEVSRNEEELRLPRPEMTPGRYRLTVRLELASGGETVESTRHEMRRWSGEDPDARCWIDRYDRLIVDGEPFFPLGMYASFPDEDDLQRLAEAGFNCVMPYGLPGGSLERMEKYLERARRHGVKTIFSTKDLYKDTRWFPEDPIGPWEGEMEILRGLVTHFRDHPNLIAWYLNDERPLSMYDRLRTHYRVTRRLDPAHPTWTVLYQVNDVRGYLGTFDVIGTDPYPIKEDADNIGDAGTHTRKTRHQVYGARPMWMVPQAFNWETYKDNDQLRPPTYREMRNMAFQCLCEGANGLIFYAYHKLKDDPDASFEERWKDISLLASELSALEPVLLSVEEPPDVRVEGQNVVSLVKQHGGTTHVFVVNPAPSDPASARVQLPAVPEKVTVDDEAAQRPDDGALSLELDPLAVRIVRLQFSGAKETR